VNFEEQMNAILEKMQIPLKAVWLPTPDSKEHARILPEENLLMIYDEQEAEAWTSLLHEVVEWRFRPVEKIYRDAFNSLVGLLEQVAYAKKEEAIQNIMKDLSTLKEFGSFLAPTNQGEKNKVTES